MDVCLSKVYCIKISEACVVEAVQVTATLAPT